MKKKQLLLSFALAVTVLFSILFQSMHSYEHLVKQLSEKECYHEYNKYNHTEITHHHQTVEVCYVCQFAFSSYVTQTNFVFQTLTFYNVTPYISSTSKTMVSFSGSLYAHRGPPTFL